MTTSARQCIECGASLKGRSDKKFCDDQCRSTFNNRINSDHSAQIRNINNILRRNRRILHEITSGLDESRIPVAQITEAGFNFKYFTHTVQIGKGTTYRLCYDYGYLTVQEDCLLVVKWGQKNSTRSPD